MASVQGVPPAKVMYPLNRGTGIAQFSGAAPLMMVQLTPIKRAVAAKVVTHLKLCLHEDVTLAGATPLARGFILLNKPFCDGLEIVLNFTGFDFFFNHMGLIQPSLLV